MKDIVYIWHFARNDKPITQIRYSVVVSCDGIVYKRRRFRPMVPFISLKLDFISFNSFRSPAPFLIIFAFSANNRTLHYIHMAHQPHGSRATHAAQSNEQYTHSPPPFPTFNLQEFVEPIRLCMCVCFTYPPIDSIPYFHKRLTKPNQTGRTAFSLSRL